MEKNLKMKQKIEAILEETGYKESRAAKMDLNDILKYVRLPSPHRFADVSFVDYCRPFMNLISISLECAIIRQYLPHCINYYLFILHSISRTMFLSEGDIVSVFVQRLLLALLTSI
jgi:hypothetical protein